MRKKAMVPGLGLLAGHVAQNAIGARVARSPKFKEGLVESLTMGALGKKSPRNLRSIAKDSVSSIAVPERNALRNEAYNVGAQHSKLLKGMSKRDLVTARAAITGGDKALQRIGKQGSPLAAKVREMTKGNTISKDKIKGISKLPSGHREPSSGLTGYISNGLIAPIAPDLAALNTGKLLASTKQVSNSKLMNKVKDKLVIQPIKKSYSQGRSGGLFNKARNNAEALLINPFSAEAEKMSHKAGTRARL